MANFNSYSRGDVSSLPVVEGKRTMVVRFKDESGWPQIEAIRLEDSANNRVQDLVSSLVWNFLADKSIDNVATKHTVMEDLAYVLSHRPFLLSRFIEELGWRFDEIQGVPKEAMDSLAQTIRLFGEAKVTQKDYIEPTEE